MAQSNEILVLGAGIIGLSTALLLQKSGYQVRIWAKATSPDITSDNAAAIWFPYLAEPKERVLGWAEATFRYLQEHGLPDVSSGCREQVMTLLFDEPADDDPWWKSAVQTFRHTDKTMLPPGYADGQEIVSILTDPSIYLDWLQKQCQEAGVTVERRSITDIEEALSDHDTVINCTGLGSRELFGDEEVYPVRGQVVRVKPNGFDRALIDDAGHNKLAYAVARFNDIVLGGTAQPNNWSLEPDPKDTEDILRKARDFSPLFNDVEIVSIGVGLRPARKTVRLETQAIRPGKHVVHNYGHGGAGFTLSWGCGQEVVRLVDELSA